jgi:hypothetical protein
LLAQKIEVRIPTPLNTSGVQVCQCLLLYPETFHHLYGIPLVNMHERKGEIQSL